MKKKTAITLISILALVLTGIIGYVGAERNQYRSYLDQKYPGNQFKLGWPKPDILYDRLTVIAHCPTEDIDFAVSRYLWGGGSFQDSYQEVKAHTRLNREIASYLKGTAVSAYIKHVTVSEKGGTDQGVNLNLVLDTSLVSTTPLGVSTALCQVIAILEARGVELAFVGTHWEDEAKIYQLDLQKDDLNKTPEEMAALARRVK